MICLKIYSGTTKTCKNDQDQADVKTYTVSRNEKYNGNEKLNGWMSILHKLNCRVNLIPIKIPVSPSVEIYV